MILQKNQGGFKKNPDNWDDIFKNHRELSPEEFQFSMGKQWKKPTDRSEGDLQVNNNSPSYQIKGENYISTTYCSA